MLRRFRGAAFDGEGAMAGHNMTQGSIAKSLIGFALPMILGNLFQMTYNAVDSIIVGRYVGTEAVAAVGAANPIMNVVIFFIGGICMGASVLMSNYYGAQDFSRLKREVSTTLLAGAAFTLVVTVLCFLLAKPVLWLIQTPAEIIDHSAGYLRIVFSGLIFTYLYNFFSNTLRSIGDSRTPLLFLILSSVLNVGLDLLLVMGMNLEVRGAAIATVVSQAVSSLLCLLYINRRIPLLQFRREEFVLDRGMLWETVSYSWVTALQQTCIYLGKLVVQGAVNPLGVGSIAAFNAVSRVDDFAITPMQSVGSAMTTFVAQNRGAGDDKRILRGFWTGMGLQTLYWAVACGVIYFGAGPLMHLFVPESGEAVIELGILYLHGMAFYYLLAGLNNGLQGYFRGMGRLAITLISTLLQIVFRVIFSYWLAPVSGIAGIASACMIGWVLMLLYEAVMLAWDRRKRGRTAE